MTFKTIEEREREAYATGHVAMAALLAQAVDSQDEATETVEEERDSALSELSDLQYDHEDLKEELEQANERIAELEAELAAK